MKLVNLLPVSATGTIDLTPLGIDIREVKATRLSGKPADSKATPEDVTLPLPTLTLPPYSFTLFRVKP